MAHEERLKKVAGFRNGGLGLIVCAVGCFAGVTGGLWGSMGAAALGAGFGAASGLIFGSLALFGASRKYAAWDQEFSNIETP